jgi:muramoyltetrapeptide carboxypeptidase
MSTTQKPPRLREGMTLGIVAPSSPVAESADAARGIARFESLGFKTVLGAHAQDKRGYLAGSDADRADDLLTMLERDDIDAVICIRGGYGAGRLINACSTPERQARLRQIAGRPPKAVIGFSDITMVHALIARELGWTSFYGPMITSFKNVTDYTIAALRSALMDVAPFDVLPSPDDPYLETIVPGTAEGVLTGGCLSLVISLLGTPWEPDLRGKLFFFEDVGEEPYEIDKMLTHLIAAGKLQECAGIIIGELADCRQRNPTNTLHLGEIFDDLVRPLGIPTLYNLPIGHGKHIATLPLGVRARLDATAKTLRIIEPGVS